MKRNLSGNYFRNKSERKKLYLVVGVVIGLFGLFLLSLQLNRQQDLRSKPAAPTTSFRFISWGDTKTGTATLASLSDQAKALNPALTLFTGDLEKAGFTQASMDTWKAAMNGNSNNGMFDKTFEVRGNHDSRNQTGWERYFNISGVVTHIGGTNYSELTKNLTYSFDYRNSHFVGIDTPGDAGLMDSSETSWLDTDLTAAESRGLTHAFIFFHGPIYYVDDHPAGVPNGLITILNKHPIVTATFGGHEHVEAYVHIDSSRILSVTHPFEEFVTGAAGAELYRCAAGRSDWCDATFGFAAIDVSGANVTANFYSQGHTTPTKTVTFKNSGTKLDFIH